MTSFHRRAHLVAALSLGWVPPLMGWIVSGVSHGVSGPGSFRLGLWLEPARVMNALLPRTVEF